MFEPKTLRRQPRPSGIGGNMALEGVRVIECGSLSAASYCARLFADFGADVIKVEPAGGDPLRGASPLFNTDDGAQSAWFSYLNFGKRSVREKSGDGTPVLAGLLAECDILICGDLAASDMLDTRLYPGLIIIDATWFGRSGPYSGFAATDSICRALAGNTQLVGPPEGPLRSSPDFQAGIAGGLWAYIAAASALLARARDGGRRLETSVHEACVTLSEYQTAEASANGVAQQRMAINRFAPTYPLGIYPAKDDWLGLTLVTPAQWKSFCTMLGLHDLANDPELTTSSERLPRADELEARFIPRLRQRNAADWFAEALVRKIPMTPVPTLEALIGSQSLRERGAIAPLSVGKAQVFSPASPFRLLGTPPARGGSVPAHGADNAMWAKRASTPVFATPAAPAGSLPLAGIRIIDFSMGWAGPLCTRTMADLGADVIKIESCSYPDWWRGVDRRPHVVAERLYEKTGRFAVMNRNKRGVTIDLTRPAGIRLAKALVQQADATVDNYSVDVLPKFGLGPDALHALKPGIVTMSMSAFGASSPWRECRAYGSTLEQASGLPRLVGEENDVPVMGHPAYGDPVGGLNGAAALLSALLHARRTGQGQHIDLSQIECMMQMTAPWLIANSANHQPPQRYGMRHPDYAPHGNYRCAGEDAWIVLAVTNDAQWQALCRVIARDNFANDATLAQVAGRRDYADEIDAALAAWCSTRDADAIMAAMQQAGIAAGVARKPLGLLDDPHLKARGFWQEIDREYVGMHAQPSVAFRPGSAPIAIRHAAPTLGERNREVFGSLLGMSDAQIDALEADGVIGEILTVAHEPERERAAV